MLRWFKNVGYLSSKELRSLFSDPVLLVLIVYMFSVALITIANMPTTEMKNGSVAVVDLDRSNLSYQLRDSLIEPSFKAVEEIELSQIDRAMDQGKYTFVLTIPANYEKNILLGQSPQIQLLVDATAMTQAGIGAAYISQIFADELRQFLGQSASALPVEVVSNVLYNPNYSSKWLMGTMTIVGNSTLLVLLLVGAAVIRERERGTIEHLLVMPVNASEIAVSKIVANGLALLCVAILSLIFIIKGVLAVPIHNHSIPLFAIGFITFLFSISSLGILLAIIAPTMPQFGLLCVPTYLVLYLLSGANSPIENMPELVQKLTQFSPTTIFAAYTQDVLFRDAGIQYVWQKLLQMAALGGGFLALALIQFKTMLSRQG
ncbi:ABC-2 type transport system permease protein [Volucribacter psittacicida]|uniref:ABC-2 type transport system permease protein n=1 Tax=Volucribacter psittacicida TaxID=203482 RepID=A0A4R1G1L8_9PAST|nr:ABC transporter permease [Volucribacter psittacicida]TCJ98928.1 ABC-2 type transport system permease protein [Volucribacter psittacicida]